MSDDIALVRRAPFLAGERAALDRIEARLALWERELSEAGDWRERDTEADALEARLADAEETVERKHFEGMALSARLALAEAVCEAAKRHDVGYYAGSHALLRAALDRWREAGT